MAGQPPMAPPPPPPPPPQYGVETYGVVGLPPKPTSGKAIASLACALGGSVLVFACPPLGVAVLVGLVLGVLGIIETGKDSTRRGRGIAIAGTLASVLAIVGGVTVFSTLLYLGRQAEKNVRAEREPALIKDQGLILERLKQYYDANDRSLGPGGPYLAGKVSTTPPAANAVTGIQDGKVTATLTLEHLVSVDDLNFAGTGGRGSNSYGSWELIVNGKSSATLRATDWGGNVLREIEIRDIGRDDFVQTK